MLTGLHALHVAVAVAVLLLAALAWLARDGRWGPQDTHVPESVAAFWHRLDLLWVVLFPPVYVI